MGAYIILGTWAAMWLVYEAVKWINLRRRPAVERPGDPERLRLCTCGHYQYWHSRVSGHHCRHRVTVMLAYISCDCTGFELAPNATIGELLG